MASYHLSYSWKRAIGVFAHTVNSQQGLMESVASMSNNCTCASSYEQGESSHKSLELSSRPRILHVISGRMFGGGQRVVQDLMRVLPTLGNLDVSLCLLGQKGDFFAEFRPYVASYNGNYRNPISAWRSARSLRSVLLELKPDIVHTHGYDAELIGALAVRALPTRHISHIHDTPQWVASPRFKHRVRRFITRVILRSAGTRWISCSEATREYVCCHLGFPKNAVHTVRNGIDVKRFSPGVDESSKRRTAEAPFVVGTAARLAPNKGIEYLIRAVAALHNEGEDLILRIAGEGPLKQNLLELASSLGVTPYVQFLGLVNDMPAFYRGLDVFVLPSLGEGLPLTVLEAMATGLPVIATPVMGIVEVIRDGVDGILVPPRNVEGLRSAIQRLAEDSLMLEMLGKNARLHIERQFALERVAGEVWGIYREFLGGATHFS